MQYSFRLDLDPLACPRPRIATRGKFAHAYYPAAYKTWKEKAAEEIAKLWTTEPLTSRVRVTARFFVKPPQKTKLDGPKPDIDNYLKSLFDAMTAAGVWKDDCQVSRVDAGKEWDDADSGYIYVEIETLPGRPPKARKKA